MERFVFNNITNQNCPKYKKLTILFNIAYCFKTISYCFAICPKSPIVLPFVLNSLFWFKCVLKGIELKDRHLNSLIELQTTIKIRKLHLFYLKSFGWADIMGKQRLKRSKASACLIFIQQEQKIRKPPENTAVLPFPVTAEQN